jgi:hypothetical protein
MKKLLKHGIIALSTALLAAAMIVSCPPPIGELDEGSTGSGLIITINPNVVGLSNQANQSRTLFPATPTFLSYELTFASAGGTGNTAVVPTINPVQVTALNTTTSITLVPGDYTVAVVAYMAADYTLPAARTVTAQAVTVLEGPAKTPINITLTAYDPVSASHSAYGDGKFGWNITGLTAVSATTATMKIMPRSSGGSTTYETINLLGTDIAVAGNANTIATPITLIPGQYQVELHATKTGGDTFNFPGEIIRVYANLTTASFSFLVENWMFTAPPPTVTITFSYNGGTVTPPVADMICEPDGTLASLPQPTKSGNTFLGWWTKNGAGNDWGDKVVVSDTAFSTSATVYARWLIDGDGTGGTITVPPMDGTPIELDLVSASGGNVNVELSDTLTITMTNFGDFDHVTWKCGSALLGTDVDSITLTGALRPNDGDPAAVGNKFLITVTAWTNDGEYQSFQFVVTVIADEP